MPVLAGRTFDSRDLNENANTVVVNSLLWIESWAAEMRSDNGFGTNR